jgi:hypothetical protein
MNQNNSPRCRALRCASGVIVSVSMIGCTSLQTVQTAAPPGVEKAAMVPAAGDKLVVSLKSGATVEMELKSVTADALIGTRDGAETSVPLLDVEKVERREFSALRTTLLVVAIGVLLYQYAIARGVSKILNQHP